MSVNAALLVAHGTVQDLDELPDFLRRIRRGRPASEELLGEMRSRYEKIGGSPHLDLARAQAAAVERVLGIPVRAAMRLWDPSVERVLEELAGEGIERVCIVPMAPYSVPVYRAAALESRQALWERKGDAPQLVCVPPWGSNAGLVEAHARQIERAIGEEPDNGANLEVILTAHSLPQSVIDAGDAYRDEFEESAKLIADRLPWPCRTAFQSAGASGGAWVGPDLADVLRTLKNGEARQVVVAPVGFLTEHVETLYDLDIELKALADELGVDLIRVPALDTDPLLIDAIAELVRQRL